LWILAAASLDQYVFSRSHWTGYTCTSKFFVSLAWYRAFNLDLSDFKYCLT
jgi:hypothetical protein